MQNLRLGSVSSVDQQAAGINNQNCCHLFPYRFYYSHQIYFIVVSVMSDKTNYMDIAGKMGTPGNHTFSIYRTHLQI